MQGKQLWIRRKDYRERQANDATANNKPQTEKPLNIPEIDEILKDEK